MDCVGFRMTLNAKYSRSSETIGPSQAPTKYGCFLKREGRSHSLWCNPANGSVEAIPRHIEISDRLATNAKVAGSLLETLYGFVKRTGAQLHLPFRAFSYVELDAVSVQWPACEA